MSSINCKNTMKFILSDKVPDLTEFVEKRLEELIDSLIIYFNHKAKPNLKKKFRRPKPVNLKHVYSCFDHIFPFLNPNKLNDSLIKKFDVVFCFLLHYDTSKINRPQAIKFFCQFLLFLNDSQIENYMFRSTVMVVPFIVFSRSENEKQSFLRIIPDNILPFGDPGQVESDEHDCVISMKQFLKFILEQWTIRPIICSNFFFMFLRILYPKMSTEHGFETFPCGFIDSNYNSNLEPPQLLFDCILQFLTELLETKNSLDPLFENAIKIQLFLAFLENCSKTQSLSENPLLLYRLEHQIIENPILVKRIQDVSLDLFGSLVNVLCIAISSCNKQENLRHASEFLEKFFPVMLSTIDRKILVAEIVKLFKKHHYEAFASSFLMMSFIHVLVNSNEANLDLWKCLTELVTTSDVLSAVACRYAQYLAVICFPLTVEENLERIKDIALNTYRRKQRTRQECSYDILMENMSDVIDKPDEYVRKNVLMSWEAHREFDEKIMKPLTIPAFQKKRSQILQKIELFLNAFAFYRTTEAAKDMRNAFAPIYSFCDLFITNRDLPPGFTIKSTLSLEVCMGRLFIAVLGQNEPTIRKVSFQLLARLVSCGALKKFFDNEILCKWYLSIATMMIHESPDFIEEGVSAALVTIQHGFTGSTTLIPMILNLIENKKIDVMKCLPFLSSIPLFQADINVN
ncbi:hypothetical protein TRFO_12968 [Tritrichomonas foetus]|uniref:Uncharacterized protein n=1 Tax=Tritrichomonas foetus TaxID=1144522 RepID=A0A1J4L430_9EUKA|nr:hypothetical protein TRFO_12968 [Tritrichomonas foetus]|eukprot:OHT16710.1 hypothetical protein TRFO_12968 [Tritrichomonas foetus]